MFLTVGRFKKYKKIVFTMIHSNECINFKWRVVGSTKNWKEALNREIKRRLNFYFSEFQLDVVTQPLERAAHSRRGLGAF